jgi:hypothetical protein
MQLVQIQSVSSYDAACAMEGAKVLQEVQGGELRARVIHISGGASQIVIDGVGDKALVVQLH